VENIRLTNDHRRTLVNLIVASGMAASLTEVNKREHQLAEKVRNRAYTAKDREVMETLPKGWLEERETIQLQVGESYTELHFSDATRMKADTGRCVIVLPARDELAAEIVQWQRDKTKHNEARDKLKDNTRAVINSVGSVRKLLEVWPEARVFTEQVKLTKPQLPALPIAALNKQLGLP
jgi:hypothetical protein